MKLSQTFMGLYEGPDLATPTQNCGSRCAHGFILGSLVNFIVNKSHNYDKLKQSVKNMRHFQFLSFVVVGFLCFRVCGFVVVVVCYGW